MTFSTRATYTQKPVRLAIQSWGAAPYHDILEHTTESTPETTQYQIIQYTSMAILAFCMYVS